MKKEPKLKFEFNGNLYEIKRTNHLYEKRNKSEHQRDAFLDDTRFVKIFKLAMINGLSSYRNKGHVVVTVPTYNNKYYSLLCVLNEYNRITIVSVYHMNKFFWKTFIKCNNRINILYSRNSEVYKVPRMNENEKQFKQLDSLCYEIRKTNEDLTFRNVMDNFIDRKLSF